MIKIFIILILTILADRNVHPTNVTSDYASAKLLKSELTTEVNMLTEQFKSINGYEDFYEVSNLGRVKSLPRTIMRSNGRKQFIKERILRAGINSGGCPVVVLAKDKTQISHKVSHLVWDNFMEEQRDGWVLVVDHIDENPRNNHLSNLQLLTNRENVSKGHQYNGRELPTGVYYDRRSKRYYSQIYITGKKYCLGMFPTKGQASLAYQEALEIYV